MQNCTDIDLVRCCLDTFCTHVFVVVLVSVSSTPAAAAATTGVLFGTTGVILWCRCCAVVGAGGGGCGPAAPLFVSSTPFRHFGGLAVAEVDVAVVVRILR